MSNRGSVVVVGAINVDLVVVAPRLPAAGETVVGDDLQTFGGGKGANAAVAAARAGATVHLVGAVGGDDAGKAALQELRDDGVAVEEVAVLNRATGVALIIVDHAGENQIAVGVGANAGVTAAHVRGALGRLLSEAACVLVSTEIPADAIAAAVEAATAAGVRCILNPAPVVPVVAELLDRGVVLTPNASELQDIVAMLGVPSAGPESDGAAVAARTHQPVVVTRGSAGVLVFEGEGAPRHVAAPVVEARDTTGAGDTFNGVLAARLAQGDDLPAAVEVAVVAASLSVMQPGARGGMPTAAAIAAAMT